MNIDDAIKEYFRRGTKLFYENTDKIPLNKAFERILAFFFHQGKELRNGVFVPLLPPADELPTLSQYRYWYRMERDLARFVASHKSSHTSNIGEKAVLGNLPQMVPGPGFLFEIHVVVADMYLISMLNRRCIIGRPVIYIIVDVFSGLIVGMYISLEGPNRQGAMLAFENMAHDKVAYCREHGVDITEDDWPSHHLPKAICANRSELLLENADILVNALDIEISNTRPCRLDWKESFERCFSLLDDMTIHWVPGSVNSLSEPRRKAHRLDGCLTLNEFRRLVIDCIIEHNMAHRLSDDYLGGDMIADGVEPYPRDLWAWGIQNRTGVLRTLPLDDLRRNLLPHAKASATPEGIYFHRMLYTCDTAIQDQWFEKVHSGWSIPIVYDPRTADCIYVRPLGSQRLEICRLLEKDKAKFEGCDWFDIEDMIARRTIRTAIDMRNSRRRIELLAWRDRIMEEARHETGEAPGDRVAEKGQERESATRDFQEQVASRTEQPQPVFKGVVERLFALDNDKLVQ